MFTSNRQGSRNIDVFDKVRGFSDLYVRITISDSTLGPSLQIYSSSITSSHRSMKTGKVKYKETRLILKNN